MYSKKFDKGFINARDGNISEAIKNLTGKHFSNGKKHVDKERKSAVLTSDWKILYTESEYV